MASLAGQFMRAVGHWVPPGAFRELSRPSALLFHGVEERIQDGRVQVVHHKRDVFYAIVKSLKENYHFLPLSALEDVLHSPARFPRTLFLMSDDGYLNNLTNAADILEELRIPWTLFVSTQHIDTGERDPLFLARLFFYFAPRGRYSIPAIGETIELGDESERKATAARVTWQLKTLPADAGKEAVTGMLAAISQSDLSQFVERFSSEKFLTWSQVRALGNRGVEIGAHANWHWPMRAGSAEYFFEQARTPRQRIETEVGPCRYFAYPFGTKADVTRDAWQAVRDAGYAYAFTTLAGSLDASRNRWLMPRYTIGLGERNVAGMVPLLRTGNLRLTYWQRRLAA